jgi:tetratricopeptide (TPR) repeat protein
MMASERGPVPELFTTFERLTRQLAPAAPSALNDGKNGHPTVAAFENYIKGLLAETPATAISYLTACLKADPGFDRARLALWEVFEEKGDHESALAAALAVAPGSRWALRSKFLVGLAQLRLKRNDDAFNTFRALSEAKLSAAALNNLGVAQIRRGNLQAGTGAPPYFKRATETDPTEPDYFFNLGYAYWLERDTGAAIYWLREAVRRNPADGDAHYVLGAALQAAGNLTEANRERELAKRLSSTYAAWEKRPAGEVVPRGLERTKDDVELPRARRLEGTLATGQRDQQELAKFYLDRARRLYETENDRDALTELNRALFLSPYDAEAHLLIGRIHLRGGRFREAIDALKISLWSDESAAGHVALANAYSGMKDVASARAEVERALVLDPASADARRLLEALPR